MADRSAANESGEPVGKNRCDNEECPLCTEPPDHSPMRLDVESPDLALLRRQTSELLDLYEKFGAVEAAEAIRAGCFVIKQTHPFLSSPDGWVVHRSELHHDLPLALREIAAVIKDPARSDAAACLHHAVHHLEVSLRQQGKSAANGTAESAHKESEQAPSNPPTIEQLERETPALDTESVEWLAARKKNQKKLGLPIATLKNYRIASHGGRKMPDKMFGIDSNGRRWRRQGTPTSAVYYYVPSLPKASYKASK